MKTIPRYALLLSLLLGLFSAPSHGTSIDTMTMDDCREVLYKSWPEPGQAASGTPDPAKVFRDCDDCPEMVVVPGGAFMMGSPGDEEGRDYNEGPQHEVTIARFAAGRYEVTVAEWDACHRAGGCSFDPPVYEAVGETCPIASVSWDDVKQYVAWLSRKTGKKYRLLTEAEWEYAARAGTTTRFPWGDDDIRSGGGVGTTYDDLVQMVWGEICCFPTLPPRPAPVGSFAPNGFGLHDMLRNVEEWVEDCWHSYYWNAPTDGSAWRSENGGDCKKRGVRGGHGAGFVRSAARSWYWVDPGIGDYYRGFRVARTLD